MSLPVPSPTVSYWQVPEHPLASYRSTFPARADVVVIGSGITGISVARTLFELDPSLRVVILEARKLSSGATGRNGGHIKPGTPPLPKGAALIVASYQNWPHRIEKYGLDEAIVLSRFESAHPAALVALAEKYNLQCDVRQCETVDAYYDYAGLERAKAAAYAISQHIPELIYQIVPGEEAQKEFRLSKSCVGGITYPAGQLWPYKLVTQLAQILVDHGVNLQTETPATKVSKDGAQWRVETPRGNILATKVVHATNGYIQYLLPSFAKLIKPTRGHMTAQLPPKSLSHPPLDRTYSFIYEDGKFDYFIQQPAYDGSKLMLGGGYHQDPHPTTFNDAQVSETSQEYLQHQLPKVFHWEGEDNSSARVHTRWTGIMGFSEDGFPWVGKLVDNLGGGEGQFVCAGYTGEGTTCIWILLSIGMPNALLCAETVAYMVLGKEPPNYFPRSYLLTEARYKKALERSERGEGVKRVKL